MGGSGLVMNKMEAASNFPTIVINSTTPRVSEDTKNSDADSADNEKNLSSQQPHQIAINMNETAGTAESTTESTTESIQKSTQNSAENREIQEIHANSAQNTSTSTHKPSPQLQTYPPHNNDEIS